MKSKILIGSILVLTLLLLMPSIPAIQQNAIEDKAINNLVEQFDFKDLRENIDFPDVKHPILYILVVSILLSRAIPAMILLLLSENTDTHHDKE